VDPLLTGAYERSRRTVTPSPKRSGAATPPWFADDYLELANALVQQRQFARAAHELQEGINILMAGRAPCTSDTPPPVDRLVMALATLYDEAGHPRRIRCMTTTTDHRPTWP
jgi:hypothetical protein